MVKIRKEEYFPRGGAASENGRAKTRQEFSTKQSRPLFSDAAPIVKLDKKAEDLIAGRGQKQRKGKKKGKNQLTSEEIDFLAEGGNEKGESLSIDEVTYDNIVEDFLSLGRVKKVKKDSLKVDLPGHLVGTVPIRNISKSYTKVLQEVAKGEQVGDPWHMLSDMFKVGQLVVVSVQKIELQEHSKQLELSLDPAQVQKSYPAQAIERGMVLIAAVDSIEDHGYIMDLGIKGTRAFLKAEESKNYIKKVNDGKPLGLGQLVECQVSSYRKDGTCVDIQLSANPGVVHKYVVPDDANLSYALLLPGMEMEAIVMKTGNEGLQVHVQDLVGVVHKHQMRENWASPTKHEVGEKLQARVLYKFPNQTEPYLTLRPNLTPHHISVEKKQCRPGDNVEVAVAEIDRSAVAIRFENDERGLVSLRRCADDQQLTFSDVKKKFLKGSKHVCKVLGYNIMDSVYICSFQTSLVETEIVHIDQVRAGMVVECEILRWTSAGAVVKLGVVRGLIPRYHFGNVPFRNPDEKFPVGTKLKAKVISKQRDTGRIYLTTKKELLKSDDPVLVTANDLKRRMVVTGTVKHVNNGGVVLEFIGGLSGFVPRKMLGLQIDESVPLEMTFFVGRLLTAQLVFANKQENKYIFSLEVRERKKRVSEDNEENTAGAKGAKRQKSKEENVSSANNEEVVGKKKNSKLDQKAAKKQDLKTPDETVSGSDEQLAINGAENGNEKKTKKRKKSKEESVALVQTEEPGSKKKKAVENGSNAILDDLLDSEGNLKQTSSSFWDESETPDVRTITSSYMSAIAAPTSDSGKKDKKSKKERKKLEEENTRNLELDTAAYKAPLRTEDDYEKLVLASPNSSMCWIQFMAFYLQNENIPKAKEVGNRALKTIMYREEQERLNVWVALLNLENKFGTEESLNACFQEALRNNDDFKVYSVMAEIYADSSKDKEADTMYKTLIRKFKSQPEAYVKYGSYLYAANRFDDARNVLKKALLNLNQKEQVRVISKHSQLEIETGDRERGKTMFDQLLGTYPKRVDLWIMYANILAKIGDHEKAKDVLKKAIDIRLPPKKVKPLFQRLFEIDAASDSPNPDAVRQLALEYAQEEVPKGGSLAIDL